MNYTDYSAEDFIKDERFIDWVNEVDPAINSFWENWIKENPSKLQEVEEAKFFIQSLRHDPPQLEQAEVNELLQNIHQNIASSPMKVVSTPSKRRYWVIGVAASLLLLLGGWWMVNAKVTYATPFAQTKSITLPDGTSVVLNANSEISMYKSWGDDIREVWLKGEAFFHVTKTPSIGKPKFIVHTEDVDVEVLGTEFNVNSRSNKTTVVLKSGKIQLASKLSKEKLAVIPGELFSIENERYSKSKTTTAVYTSWTEKKYVFDKTPFAHLAEILENNYGYTVNIKSKQLLQLKLTGTAPVKENPEVLMKVLETMFDLEISDLGDNTLAIEKKAN